MDHSFFKSRQAARRFPLVGSDKLIYAMDGISRFMIHYIIEGQGQLDVPCLTQAIDIALAKTPILKSIARPRWFAPYWEVLEDFTPHSILTVREFSREVDVARAANDLIESYVNDYIDITLSPPARFLLIRLPVDRWIFVVKAHHSSLDAAGLLYVIEDVKIFYEKLVRGEPIPPFGEIGDRSRKTLFRRVSLLLWCHVILMAIWRKTRTPGRLQKSHIQFSAQTQSGGISYRSIRFEGKDYTSFRTRCKSLGLTTNELVLVALCRSIHKWNADSERTDSVYSMVVPVDLRRYVRQRGEIPKIMASFIGGTQVVIPAGAATTLEKAIEYVRQETRFIKNHHMALLPNLIFPLLYFIPAQWLRRATRSLYEWRARQLVPTSVVSNVGKIDRILSHSADFAIKDIQAVATAYAPAGLFVAPFSYLHQQTITITYRKDTCSEKEIDEFVEMFSQELVPGSSGNENNVSIPLGVLEKAETKPS